MGHPPIIVSASWMPNLAERGRHGLRSDPHTLAIPAAKVALFVAISLAHVARFRSYHGETMTSIDEMSETEAREYIRAEILALRPILGELTPAFWQTLTNDWKREGQPGYHP